MPNTKYKLQVAGLRSRTKSALTLIEMLIVVAVIVILTTMVIGITAGIDNRAKEELAESTIAILKAALEQFRDYGYDYKDPYSDFDFPLDCSGYIGFDQFQFTDILAAALGVGAGLVQIVGFDQARPGFGLRGDVFLSEQSTSMPKDSG